MHNVFWSPEIAFFVRNSFLHTGVSVRACTSCRPFVIKSKQKDVVAELLDTVAKHRFVQKTSLLSE